MLPAEPVDPAKPEISVLAAAPELITGFKPPATMPVASVELGGTDAGYRKRKPFKTVTH